MAAEKLVHMANQIADFFRPHPRDKAVAGVAGHINSFWDPRMRTDLLEIVSETENGLDPLVIESASLIRLPEQDRERDAHIASRRPGTTRSQP